MRQFAERLAKACPGRFVFTEGANGGRWYVGHPTNEIGIDYASGIAEQWAFWGTLAVERESTLQRLDARLPLLEAVADAVCRSFEQG